MLNIKERDANTVQPPEADTKVLFLDAADSKLKLKDSTGAIEELSVDLTGIPAGGDTGDVLAKASADDEDVEWVDPTGGVKEYVALLTQTGTNAPVATILKNTLGGVPVWTYSTVGTYLATLASAFTVNKTIVLTPYLIEPSSEPIPCILSKIISANVIEVYTGTLNNTTGDEFTRFDFNNSTLTASFIKIEVYP